MEHNSNAPCRTRLYAGYIGDTELWWCCWEVAGDVTLHWYTSQFGNEHPQTTIIGQPLGVRYANILRALWTYKKLDGESTFSEYDWSKIEVI